MQNNFLVKCGISTNLHQIQIYILHSSPMLQLYPSGLGWMRMFMAVKVVNVENVNYYLSCCGTISLHNNNNNNIS
eukprot:2164575-Ditylum_brightwellii.AAC.1